MRVAQIISAFMLVATSTPTALAQTQAVDDPQLVELARETLRLETQSLRNDVYWSASSPPPAYTPGSEVEIDFFFPDSRDGTGFCSDAFEGCRFYVVEEDGQLYQWGAVQPFENCDRPCVIRRFQDEYFGRRRPIRPQPAVPETTNTKRETPLYFDPSRFAVRPTPTEEERTPFDLSLTLTWKLESLDSPPVDPGTPPPENYSKLRETAIREARGLLPRCGGTAIVSIPRYSARDRSIDVHFGFPYGDCGIAGAIYNYHPGRWSYSLAIYREHGPDALRLIKPILLERITVTTTPPADVE